MVYEFMVSYLVKHRGNFTFTKCRMNMEKIVFLKYLMIHAWRYCPIKAS